MEQTKTVSAKQRRYAEHEFVQETCHTILFPFVELMRRTIPFSKGVLTAIRPMDAPTPVFEAPPFSPFLVAAHFADREGDEELGAPEIISLVHALDGFPLNVLLVAHRQAEFYRYGLVLESEVRLCEAHIKTAYQQALKRNRLDRLIVEREPSLAPHPREEQMGLVFEAYRTLTTERYVKLYFRNRFDAG